VSDARIDEASGLVASATHTDTLWVHNDSGSSARVFAIGVDGTVRSGHTLADTTAVDWEDMALQPIAGGPDQLWVADFGDNLALRTSVTLVRVDEPGAIDNDSTIDQVDVFEVTYGDGHAHDAEALLVDPRTGAVGIVTKDGDGGELFVIETPVPGSNVATLAATAFMPGPLATAGDISADGQLIAIRNYGSAWIWLWPESSPWADVLAAEPCDVPLIIEPQGETLAIAPDRSALFTLSEGQGQPIYRYALD